jgi:hypothetical protein
MNRVRIVLAALSIAGCGGMTAAEASGDDAQAPPAVPSFGDAGGTMRAPVACEPCAANDACGGPQAACVASLGPAFCAPGCSKDGFCASDRTCTWVSDPTGRPWRACLPAHDPCGPLHVAPRDHTGTW